MAHRPMMERVEKLEQTVESLAKLPGEVARLADRVGGLEVRVGGLDVRLGTVELQIVQLRSEMKDEFSAMRREMATKQDLTESCNSLRDELRQDIAGMGHDLAAAILETRREGAAHRRHTAMQLDDIISRLKVIGEGNPPSV